MLTLKKVMRKALGIWRSVKDIAIKEVNNFRVVHPRAFSIKIRSTNNPAPSKIAENYILNTPVSSIMLLIDSCLLTHKNLICLSHENRNSIQISIRKIEFRKIYMKPTVLLKFFFGGRRLICNRRCYDFCSMYNVNQHSIMLLNRMHGPPYHFQRS